MYSGTEWENTNNASAPFHPPNSGSSSLCARGERAGEHGPFVSCVSGVCDGPLVGDNPYLFQKKVQCIARRGSNPKSTHEENDLGWSSTPTRPSLFRARMNGPGDSGSILSSRGAMRPLTVVRVFRTIESFRTFETLCTKRSKIYRTKIFPIVQPVPKNRASSLYYRAYCQNSAFCARMRIFLSR